MPNNHNPFETLRAYIEEDLELSNALILSLIDSKAELIPIVSKHLLFSGGKRLREMLTLAMAKMLGYSGSNHIKLATAVSFIHNATLLHDDVIDKSELRRGTPTANKVWGNKTSILVGDYLLSQAFKLMVETESLEALTLLSSCSIIITEAEVKQLSMMKDIEVTRQAYFDLIDGKTASLFAAACEVGVIVATSDQKMRRLARQFGLNFGICFQVVDDTLDYIAEEKTFGKRIGDDFREGKVTLPAIIAYELATAEERKFLQQIMLSDNHEEADLQQIIDIFNKYDTLQKSFAEARKFAEAGKKALLALPAHPLIQLLSDVLDYTVIRTF